MARNIGRRQFISVLGSTAVAWPLAARAQQSQRTQRVGVLLALDERDPEGQARIATFRQELQRLGWEEGRNLRIDVRWPAADVDRIKRDAADLVGLAPDVIFINSQPVFDAMRDATRTIPVVFVQVTDPVGSGLITSLARPGGNFTGFSNYDSVGGKWLELLREIAPTTTRALILHNPQSASNIANLHAIDTAATSLGVESIPAGVHDAAEIERQIAAFAHQPLGGMIVLASPTANFNRDLIIALAARHSLPSVYPYRYFITSGGLVSYGVDNKDLYRRGAAYVDRILKGETPGNLPIQQPTKLELVINLKTAKTLGLEVPATLLARADEVIE
jgi:putative ABC transport system substrate-binding protein